MITNQPLTRIKSFFQDLVDFAFDEDLHGEVNQKFQDLKQELQVYEEELEGYVNDLKSLSQLDETVNDTKIKWLQTCVGIITGEDQSKKTRIQVEIDSYMKNLDDIAGCGKEIRDTRKAEVELKRTELLSILEKLEGRLKSSSTEHNVEIEAINRLYQILKNYSSTKIKEIEDAVSSTKDEFREIARRLTSDTEESVILELFLKQDKEISLRNLIEHALRENEEFVEVNLKQAAIRLWENYLVEFYVQ